MRAGGLFRDSIRGLLTDRGNAVRHEQDDPQPLRLNRRFQGRLERPGDIGSSLRPESVDEFTGGNQVVAGGGHEAFPEATHL